MYLTKHDVLPTFDSSRSQVADGVLDNESESIITPSISPCSGISERSMDTELSANVGSTSGLSQEASSVIPVISHCTLSQQQCQSSLDPDNSEKVSIDFLNCRNMDMNSTRKEQMSSIVPKIAHCRCSAGGAGRGRDVDDPTEAFFYSMGQSVKRLPAYLQARVKLKVCQLVTDAEIECLDSKSSIRYM